MRELRVVGVEADGSHVICKDSESGDKFRIPADERLRAAARGDISRLGQIEIDMESSLRPREIQARIRAGATVAEVAAMAGVPIDKVERFAHPVLLERTRATELASMSHPLRDDGPSVATLGEVVSESLTALGHGQHEVDWDAWKGDDGFWVVQVAWSVGRTDNRAHWRFQPGAHGGTADPLDDLADELTHPESISPRRRLTPVATPTLTVGPDPVIESVPGEEAAADAVTIDANRLIDAQRSRTSAAPPTHDQYGTVALDFGTDDRPSAWTTPDDDTASDTAGPGPAPDGSLDEDVTDAGGDEQTPDPSTEPARPRRKNRKPTVPAWEDVLLGVRSNGHS